MSNPLRLIVIGGVLLFIGWIVPLFMVMQWIEGSLFIAFASYAASVAGLVTGLLGVYMYFPFRRNTDK